MLINLPYNVDLPARRSIFGVSCSSRTAKRSLAQYARLLSVGVKWLAIVLRLAMALDHLRIAPAVVSLLSAFFLAGSIVFALALAVGLGSEEFVTKSLERDAKKVSSDTVEDPLRHL